MNDKIVLENAYYVIVEDNKEAFDIEALKLRYTDFFEKYDYIVGDVSAEKLRLRGFYDASKKVSNDTKITYLSTYIKEYCAYGCGYYVLKKVAK